jgi:general secretion pathway protein H
LIPQPVTHRGFSLVELVLVMAILGVVAGLTVPALARWSEDQPLSQARDLVLAELAHARLAAIESGTPSSVRYQPGSSLLEIKSGIPTQRIELVLPESVKFATLDRSRGEWSPPIRFYPGGTASEALVILQDDTDREERIVVARLTGAASSRGEP